MLRTAANKVVLFNQQEFPKTRGDTACRIFCIGGHHLQRAISPFRVVLQLVAHLPRPKT